MKPYPPIDGTARTLAVIALLILTVGAAWGDRVETADGSVIVGKVTSVADGIVHIETGFAGKLAVPQNQVTGITTDEPQKIALASGNVLVGTVNTADGVMSVRTSLGELQIEEDTVAAIWAQDQDSPEVAALKQRATAAESNWEYELAADLAGKTGNTERLATSGSFTASLNRPNDRLKYSISAAQAEENGNKTVNEAAASADYERDIGRRHSWYVRILLEHDEVEDLDLRTTAATGYGYYLLRKDDHVLRGRIGALLRQESWADNRSEQTVGVDFGLHHRLDITDWSKIVTDITYTPSLEDFGDYRADHSTWIEAALANTANWKLRLGVANNYTSRPAAAKERLDTAYFARLVFAWE